MNKPHQKPESSPTKVEGEGSYTATRKYNQHLADATSESSTEKAAEEARRALEGPEAAELTEAERIGKSGGPKQARAAKP